MAYAQTFGQIFKVAVKKLPEIYAVIGPILTDPDVLNKIKELIRKIGRSRQPKTKKITLEEISQRVTSLEQLSIENEKLVSDLEKRQEITSQVIQTLSARILILAIVTGISFIISIVALTLLLLRH